MDNILSRMMKAPNLEKYRGLMNPLNYKGLTRNGCFYSLPLEASIVKMYRFAKRHGYEVTFKHERVILP